MSLFWSEHKFDNESVRYWKINHREIWIRKLDDEWHIGSRFLPGPDQLSAPGTVLPFANVYGESRDAPEDIEWMRFVESYNSFTLQFTPLPPDKPVVVNPESSIQILPGHKALFFMPLPVWIEISIKRSEPHPLVELPTDQLSNTWFGDPQAGFLSYGLESRAGRKFEPIRSGESIEILAPVWIKNSSTKSLDVKDVCIHGEHLKVYEGASGLWTNEVNISYYGENLPSKVSYSEKRPSFESLQRHSSGPRIKLRQDLLSRSFSFLKNFTA